MKFRLLPLSGEGVPTNVGTEGGLPHNIHNLTGHHNDFLRNAPVQILLCLFMCHDRLFDFLFLHIGRKLHLKAQLSVEGYRILFRALDEIFFLKLGERRVRDRL